MPKAALLTAFAFIGVFGAGSVSLAATPRPPAGTEAGHTTHGSASVACAGSLLKLYYDTLGPAFKKATGDSFGGPPCAGSSSLAQEINAGEIDPGAFLAIGAAAIKTLFPTDRAKFAMAVASDQLVVAYSKHSRYYSKLNEIRDGKKPLSDLFSLFTTRGFKLGRTDPTQDPQGAFFILMAKLAQGYLHLHAGEANKALGITGSRPYGSPSQIFSETALPTDIQTGIVDAGSEYLPQAKQYGLDYISLPTHLNFSNPGLASYYNTVGLNVNGSVQRGEVIYLESTLVLPAKGTTVGAADEAADQAFVAFMLGANARKDLTNVGYLLPKPVLVLASGVTAQEALPPAVLKLFRGLGGKTGS